MIELFLIKDYFLKWKGWKTFLFLIIITVLTNFAVNELFLTEGLYYHSLGSKLATDRIAKMIKLSQKWQWVGYIFASVIILIRVSFTTLCVYIGSFLGNLNIRFKDLFKVALLADFVFVLAGITKLGFLFFRPINKLEDMQFQPLSLIELFDKGVVKTFLIYPYSLISVFELLYWLALAWLLSSVIERPFFVSLKLVARSYGLGLLLWVLFVVFITESLS